MSATRSAAPNLQPVFARLRAIMAPYAARLDRKRDTDTELYVDTRHAMKKGKPLFFGAVRVGKAYVSYHLMPVYVQPALLAGVSRELKSRMHGKSCFNFAAVDEPLFEELAELTRRGFDFYRAQGFT